MGGKNTTQNTVIFLKTISSINAVGLRHSSQNFECSDLSIYIYYENHPQWFVIEHDKVYNGISSAPIFTDDGNYDPNERTRRIVHKLEKEFGMIEDRVKIRDIGTRDFSKIDLTIFNKTNNHANFYEKCLEIIKDEYGCKRNFSLDKEFGNMNDYFISNSTIQKPLLYLLANDAENKKVLLDFCKEYGDELTPTFNFPKQFSILHCLAKQQTVFTKDEEKLFSIVAARTHTLTRNNINRTFVEVAISQNSPNIDFIFERSVLANRNSQERDNTQKQPAH